MMRNAKVIRWIFALMLAAAASANAQVATGTYLAGSFDQYGIESINVGNLNDVISIPVLDKPGRGGTDFSYTFVYNTSIWTPSLVAGTMTWVPDINWGWIGQTQVATGYISYLTTSPSCLIGSRRFYNTEASRFVYHDKFGQAIGFPTAGYNAGACPGSYSHFPAAGGYGYTLTGGGQTIVPPSGTQITPPSNSGVGPGIYEDTNGNEITTSTGSTFVDTLGKNALVISGSPTSSQVFTYVDSSGTNQQVTVTYISKTVQTAFGCSGASPVAEFGPETENLVSKIAFPDGTYYQFSYEPTTVGSSNVTGRLSSVQLPTGGTISYSYADGANHISCSDGSVVQLARTTSDGTTTYTRSGASSTASSTAVQTPIGDHRTYKFVISSTISTNQFYPTHVDAYDGAPTGTPRTDSAICYDGNTTACDTTVPTLPLTEIRSTVTLDGTAVGGVDTYLNANGQVSAVNQYDYGTSTRGALLLETANTYGYGYFMTNSTQIDGSGHTLSSTQYSYDAGTPTSTSGLPQHVSVSGSRGNLTSVVYCLTTACSGTGTRVTNYTYNDTGSVLSVQNAPDSATTIAYDTTTGSYPTTITMPSTGVAHALSYSFDPNSGLLMSATDQNGNATTYAYDSMLRLHSVTYPAVSGSPAHSTTTYSYQPAVISPFSPAEVTTTATQTAGTNIVTTQTLDAYGRTEHTAVADGSGADTVDVTFDVDGRMHTVSNPHRSGSNPTDGVITYGYDSLNRVISSTAQDGSSISTSAWSGKVDVLTDAAGGKRELLYDGAGRLSSVFEPDSTGAFNYETTYQYVQSYSTSPQITYATVVNQMGALTPSSNSRVRTFTVDGMGRTVSENTPEAGTTYFAYNNGTPCTGSFTSICVRTDAGGTTTTYTYDALDRLTGKAYSDTTHAITYSYDQSSFNGLTISNAIGQMTGMTDGSGQTGWSFDTLGRANTVRKTIGSVTAQSSVQYNLDSSVASMSDFGGVTFTYGYDSTGRPTSLSDGAGNSYASSVAYYPPGLLQNVTHQASGGSSFTRANGFNSLLEPTSIASYPTGSPSSPIMSYSLGYSSPPHNNGNLASIADGIYDWSQNYLYDQLNRLSQASNPSTSGNSWTQTFAYDPWGNLNGQTQSGSVTGYNWTGTANPHNQLPFQGYDANGRMTSDGVGDSYTYDAEGRILTANSNAYIYDGNGYRVSKSVSGTTTLYWPGLMEQIIDESNSSGSVMAKQVYFAGLLVWRDSAAANPSLWLFQDHLGSTRLTAHTNGSVQDKLSYYPFGSTIPYSSSVSDNHYGYAGYESDGDSDHAKFRNVNTTYGRFLSPDPYDGSYDLSNPQSLNRYSYVTNQPSVASDPSGLQKPSTSVLPCPPNCNGGMWPTDGNQPSMSNGNLGGSIFAGSNEFGMMSVPVVSYDWWLPALFPNGTFSDTVINLNNGTAVTSTITSEGLLYGGIQISTALGFVLASGPAGSPSPTASNQCTSTSCHAVHYVQPKHCDIAGQCTPAEKAQWCKSAKATAAIGVNATGGGGATPITVGILGYFFDLLPLSEPAAVTTYTANYIDQVCSE